MIPRMRAVAIDDEDDHLKAINRAATKAGFGCVPLLYPTDTDAKTLKALALDGAHIRIIISDLHLDATSQTRDAHANFGIIAGLIYQMELPKWTPYVLVIWTQHPTDVEGLSKYLEEKLEANQLPSLLFPLNKGDYNIPNGEPDHEKLWQDLRDKINGSRSLNVLLQWEKEIIQSADNVVRRLLEVARSGKPKLIPFNEELDRVLSSIAQTATSLGFASQEPRAAANGGLLPLLVDEMEHLTIGKVEFSRWTDALSHAVAKAKISPSAKEIAVLNDALHISKDGVATGSDRGAVVSQWHSGESFEEIFGLDCKVCFETFGLTKWPDNPAIKYVQIEGLCDSAQQKKGVVPFALACEVPGDTILNKYAPASIQESPVYVGATDAGRKLVVNLRYFFTVERETARKQKANFRLRESMINKWAFAWANHAIRPGTVEFHPK
jgi:hypothetical protein